MKEVTYIPGSTVMAIPGWRPSLDRVHGVWQVSQCGHQASFTISTVDWSFSCQSCQFQRAAAVRTSCTALTASGPVLFSAAISVLVKRMMSCTSRPRWWPSPCG